MVQSYSQLRDSSDLVNKVDELFQASRDNVECDFCNGAALQISHESTVVLLLRKLLIRLIKMMLSIRFMRFVGKKLCLIVILLCTLELLPEI